MTTWKTDQSGLSASTTYSNGSVESRLISAIPATDTLLPADPLPLAQVQQTRLDLMDSSYNTAVCANITYMATTFQADPVSLMLVSQVLSAQAGVAPTGFGWYDINNVKVAMTNAQLQGLASAIFLRGQPLFDNKQTKKAAIRAATTNAQVQAVIF